LSLFHYWRSMSQITSYFKHSAWQNIHVLLFHASPLSEYILTKGWTFDFDFQNYLCNQLTLFGFLLVKLYWCCCPGFRISGFLLRCSNPNVLEHDIGDLAPIQQQAHRVNPEKRARSKVESYYGYCRSWLLIVSRVGSQ
jgi:hypothetical protein